MKMFKAIITSISIILIAMQSYAEPSDKKTSTIFTVNGMVCAFCAQGIEKKLSSMPDIQAVHVNLEEKIVSVEAKTGKTVDEKRIISEIKDAGYDVTKVETVTGGEKHESHE